MKALVRQRGYGYHANIIYPQKGGGIGSLFRGFIRLAKPLFKTGLQLAKPRVKKIAKKAIKLAVDISTDYIEKKNL